jgi:ATP-dependent Clp protease ATP-binding subunit ClpB
MGSHIIQEKYDNMKDLDTAMESAKTEVLGLLKQNVRPEFINRIDDIIMFSPLTQKDIRKIVSLQLKGVKKMLEKQHIVLDATDEAISFLASRGFDPQFGARPVKRVVQREVLNKLSKEILAGNIKTDSIILIDEFNEELVFRNETNPVETE